MVWSAARFQLSGARAVRRGGHAGGSAGPRRPRRPRSRWPAPRNRRGARTRAASPSVSRSTGRSLTTTGVPAASDSSGVNPNPSRCEGSTVARAPAYSAAELGIANPAGEHHPRGAEARPERAVAGQHERRPQAGRAGVRVRPEQNVEPLARFQRAHVQEVVVGHARRPRSTGRGMPYAGPDQPHPFRRQLPAAPARRCAWPPSRPSRRGRGRPAAGRASAGSTGGGRARDRVAAARWRGRAPSARTAPRPTPPPAPVRAATARRRSRAPGPAVAGPPWPHPGRPDGVPGAHGVPRHRPARAPAHRRAGPPPSRARGGRSTSASSSDEA